MPNRIGPPNHKFVRVAVMGVTVPDGGPVTITITGITQDETVNGQGDGRTCPDAVGVGSETALVRAERTGLGDGRVYHIGFRADDSHGGQCEGTVTVCVPLQRNDVCVDEGGRFDSTSPTCGGTCAGICRVAGSLASASCADETLPAGIEQRIRGARNALAQAARTASKAKANRLIARAAKLARKAIGLMAKAETKGAVSSRCAQVVEQALGDAETLAEGLLP
jgi:hypothetical protein